MTAGENPHVVCECAGYYWLIDPSHSSIFCYKRITYTIGQADDLAAVMSPAAEQSFDRRHHVMEMHVI